VDHKQFTLPTTVTGKRDMARLIREMAALEDYLHQAGLRSSTENAVKMPKTSRLLDEIVTANGLNLLDGESRKKLLNSLKLIQQKAPLVHMSFSVDPSAAFMQKIVTWWRENIDPFVLVEIGLQPNIAAGCLVRTSNRQYDFSLRRRLQAKKADLAKYLEEPATA
jgi:F0F1-type ATP synthase delta subunit